MTKIIIALVIIISVGSAYAMAGRVDNWIKKISEESVLKSEILSRHPIGSDVDALIDDLKEQGFHKVKPRDENNTSRVVYRLNKSSMLVLTKSWIIIIHKKSDVIASIKVRIAYTGM